MTEQLKFGCRILGSLAVIAALAVGTPATGNAQSVQLMNGNPEGASFGDAPSRERERLKQQNSVEETGTPCGGDSGMLESLEAERHGLAEVNPCDAPNCD